MVSNNFSYPPSRRLKKPADFKRVYQNKQWGGTQHFTYNVRACASGQTKFGVTVSKKVSKNAVDRNRIKRQIKEFLRLHQHQLNSAELVVTAKPGCAKADDQQRYSSLEQLWEKILKWQRWHERQA